MTTPLTISNLLIANHLNMFMLSKLVVKVLATGLIDHLIQL